MPKKQLTRLLSAKFWNTRVSDTRPDDVSTDRKIVKRAEDRVDSDGPPKTTQLELLLAPKATTTPTPPSLLAQNVHGVSLSLSPRRVQLKFARGRGGGESEIIWAGAKISPLNQFLPHPEHILAVSLSMKIPEQTQH